MPRRRLAVASDLVVCSVSSSACLFLLLFLSSLLWIALFLVFRTSWMIPCMIVIIRIAQTLELFLLQIRQRNWCWRSTQSWYHRSLHVSLMPMRCCWNASLSVGVDSSNAGGVSFLKESIAVRMYFLISLLAVI